MCSVKRKTKQTNKQKNNKRNKKMERERKMKFIPVAFDGRDAELARTIFAIRTHHRIQNQTKQTRYKEKLFFIIVFFSYALLRSITIFIPSPLNLFAVFTCIRLHGTSSPIPLKCMFQDDNGCHCLPIPF